MVVRGGPRLGCADGGAARCWDQCSEVASGVAARIEFADLGADLGAGALRDGAGDGVGQCERRASAFLRAPAGEDRQGDGDEPGAVVGVVDGVLVEASNASLGGWHVEEPLRSERFHCRCEHAVLVDSVEVGGVLDVEVGHVTSDLLSAGLTLVGHRRSRVEQCQFCVVESPCRGVVAAP